MDIKPAPKIKKQPKPAPKEEVLIEDQSFEEPLKSLQAEEKGHTPPKPVGVKDNKLKQFGHWFMQHKKISIPLTLLLLFGGAGTTYALLNKPKPASQPVAKVEVPPVEEPPKPTTLPSKLTGLEVAPDLAARPITGMMIENSPEARPQSGIWDAGTIFEATAEGGITRFLVLWQEGKPGKIGPVRSLRPYYIDWALPFQAAVGHVGGSPQALSEAKAEGLRDIDQFANGSSYYRDSARYAPHNMYTSTDSIDKLQASKGFTKSEFTPWPRKDESKAATATANKIGFDIINRNFHVDYTYDANSNSYLRIMAGKPHMDKESGKQLNPKVVVLLKMAHRLVDSQHYGITTTGSGEAFIYQDGIETKGSWKKDSRSSMFKFVDANGAEIKLNKGQVWISILPLDKNPAVTP